MYEDTPYTNVYGVIPEDVHFHAVTRVCTTWIRVSSFRK